MKPNLTSEHINLVFVGSFNPAIFHPSWYKSQGICDSLDNSENSDYLSTIDATQFKLPDEISIRVFRNKFIAETSRESSIEKLLDIVAGTFEVLHHTPIERIGINVDRIYEGFTPEAWQKIGKTIAPQDLWRSVYSYIEDLEQKQQEVTGLWSQTMSLPRNDQYKGQLFHKTSVVNRRERTLQVSINNDLDASNNEHNAARGLSIVKDSAVQMLDDSKKLINKFMTETTGEEQ